MVSKGQRCTLMLEIVAFFGVVSIIYQHGSAKALPEAIMAEAITDGLVHRWVSRYVLVSRRIVNDQWWSIVVVKSPPYRCLSRGQSMK